MDRPSYQRWGSSTEQRPLRILSFGKCKGALGSDFLGLFKLMILGFLGYILDGGGVRGYSTLLLLQEVMHKLFVEMKGRAPEAWEMPRPCDHFDLIVGTGTGG